MMKGGANKQSVGKLGGIPPAGAKSPLENAKPKGFTSGSKRLQPIKATDLRNSDMAGASPIT